MDDKITHIGIVDSVSEHKVIVRILQASACSGCHAAGLCHSSESKEKLIDVYVDSASAYTKGQKVIIEGSTHRGLKAVILAYVIPLVAIVVTLALAIPRIGEPSAALLSLIVVAAYYAILYTQRSHLAKRFTFKIIKQQNNESI